MLLERVVPRGSSIFVIPDELVQKSKGGIILTDWSAKRPTSGTIIALGPLVTEYNKGDRVMYGDFSGLKVTIDDREVLIMQPADIVAQLLPDYGRQTETAAA